MWGARGVWPAMRISSITAALACIGLAIACGASDSFERAGETTIAVSTVPAGVGCIAVEARGVRNNRQLFPVTPGSPATLRFADLPVGRTTFEADAFDAPCEAVSASSKPSWVAEPVTVELVASTDVSIAFKMRRANAGVGIDVDWDDPTPADAGAPDSGSQPDGTATDAAPRQCPDFCHTDADCQNACPVAEDETFCCDSTGGLGFCYRSASATCAVADAGAD